MVLDKEHTLKTYGFGGTFQTQIILLQNLRSFLYSFLGLLLREKWETFGLRLSHAQQQMKMTENALLFAFVEVFYLLFRCVDVSLMEDKVCRRLLFVLSLYCACYLTQKILNR